MNVIRIFKQISPFTRIRLLLFFHLCGNVYAWWLCAHTNTSCAYLMLLFTLRLSTDLQFTLTPNPFGWLLEMSWITCTYEHVTRARDQQQVAIKVKWSQRKSLIPFYFSLSFFFYVWVCVFLCLSQRATPNEKHSTKLCIEFIWRPTYATSSKQTIKHSGLKIFILRDFSSTFLAHLFVSFNWLCIWFITVHTDRNTHTHTQNSWIVDLEIRL